MPQTGIISIFSPYTLKKLPIPLCVCMCVCTRVCIRACTQSCPTLLQPQEHSLPGFSVHGILQARILECMTISFSRGSPQPRDQTRISCKITGSLFIPVPLGKPIPYLSLSHFFSASGSCLFVLSHFIFPQLSKKSLILIKTCIIAKLSKCPVNAWMPWGYSAV